MLVFQDLTKDLAWAISSFHSATDHSPTPPPLPQKWPLKCVPISLPSSQAPRSCFTVSRMPCSSLKPMSERPGECCGGRYRSRLPSGSMYTPLRKYVMVARLSLATLRKCEKSFWLSSPAPSQEKTTNCGGRCPGFSRSARGSRGCAPVNAVEPSPISRTAFFGAGAPTPFLAPCAPSPGAFSPWAPSPCAPFSAPVSPIPHPASAAAQTAMTATLLVNL